MEYTYIHKHTHTQEESRAKITITELYWKDMANGQWEIGEMGNGQMG